MAQMDHTIDQPTVTGDAGDDRAVDRQQPLREQLDALRRELASERARGEALRTLVLGEGANAGRSAEPTASRSTVDLIGSIPWDKPKAFLAFAAVVFFGAVRFADGAFDARLGLTPEDVGLNAAVILARSTASAVLLLASLVLLGFPAFAMRRGLHWGWVAAAPLLLFLGTLLFRGLFALPSFVDTGLDNFAYNLVIVVAGSVLGLLVAFQDELLQRRRAAAPEPAGGQEPPPAADGTASAGRRIVVVELALAAAIVFGLAGIVGYASAARVMHGELLRCGCVQVAKHNISLPWLSGTPGFLAVRVQRAEVVWNTPPQHPPSWLSLPMSAMYLGQADGMIVVYDPAQARPLRFPVGSVLVRVDPRPATFSESSSDDGY